ncbi:MAG: presqualene diphosphate synthase HpnD [Verrucomicrobiales bacterium]
MQASEAITRKSASNLALAFILLPKEKRQGMAALYAFCREVDDVADEETVPAPERQKQLNAWREDIQTACNGGKPRFTVNQELQPFIKECRLPYTLFDELIKGVEMDLVIDRYQTLNDLEQYCYRVASVVGLLSIEVFGYHDKRCRDYAVHLGKALQLTNILRDVRNDAERGRIYLPMDGLNRFGVSPEDIFAGKYSKNYYNLAQHIGNEARQFYRKAREALPEADRRSMATAELMGSVYWQLFQKLERRQFNVFDHKETRLNKAQKVFLIMRMWFKTFTGSLVPNYGVS